MLLKKSLYFFNKPLSLYQQGIMAERKKIFYAKKAAKGKEQLAQPLSLAARGIQGYKERIHREQLFLK